MFSSTTFYLCRILQEIPGSANSLQQKGTDYRTGTTRALCTVQSIKVKKYSTGTLVHHRGCGWCDKETHNFLPSFIPPSSIKKPSIRFDHELSEIDKGKGARQASLFVLNNSSTSEKPQSKCHILLTGLLGQPRNARPYH